MVGWESAGEPELGSEGALEVKAEGDGCGSTTDWMRAGLGGGGPKPTAAGSERLRGEGLTVTDWRLDEAEEEEGFDAGAYGLTITGGEEGPSKAESCSVRVDDLGLGGRGGGGAVSAGGWLAGEAPPADSVR